METWSAFDATSASIKCEPIKPAPPVTRILIKCPLLDRVPSDRVVAEVERFHQFRIIQVPAVEYHRLFQFRPDALEVGMPELVPLSQDQQRVGVLEGLVVGFVVGDAIAEK